jgi:hypothetical protein
MTIAECAMYFDCVAALLEAFVRALTPARVSGRSYLRALLKEEGVLQLVPDACVADLVEQTIKLARMARRPSKASPKSEMMEMLDGTAMVTTLWIRGGDLPVKEDGYVPRTLVKHGVQRGIRKATGRPPPRRHHVFESYSDFRNATVTCAMCDWSGQGWQMKVGEIHEEARVREYYCPKCGGGRSDDYLAVAPLPRIGESHE